MDLLTIADSLSRTLRAVRFDGPVTHVYDPLEYARAGYAEYVRRYGTRRREVILLGMNPGPWGMAQTGVPFGDVSMVRDWLGIDVDIDKPLREHPKKRVDGFTCPRGEVSGARLWGWARDTYKAPKRFFARFFVANYCPLAFLEASGRNRTPDRLPVAERAALSAACDDALRRTVGALRPTHVVGVGAFAAAQAERALDGIDVRVGRVLHPSPASPVANRGWAKQATAELAAQGILASR